MSGLCRRDFALGTVPAEADEGEVAVGAARGGNQLVGCERCIGGESLDTGADLSCGGDKTLPQDADGPIDGVVAGWFTDSQNFLGCGRGPGEGTTVLSLPQDGDWVDWVAAVVQGGQRPEQLLVDWVGEVLHREIGADLPELRWLMRDG
ncbi:hypothetical protein GCM10010214_12980 [Streptomyces abikoensis]|nr:hypothetical protein GCM10010214_12980 [Streptomyces abikoensis]